MCYPCGLVCVVSSGETQVPMVRRDVNLTMCPNGVYGTEQFLFFNKSNESIATEFRFPTKRCRVHNLRFRTDDGTWKKMKVEEKIKAEATYQNAVSSGNQATIARESNDDVLSIKIGRLQSYQMVTVEISYFVELEWIGFYTHRHQLTATPPYIPSGEMAAKCQEKFPKLCGGVDLLYGVFLTVNFVNTNEFTADVIADNIQKGLKCDESFNLNVPRQKLTGTRDVIIRMHPTVCRPSVNYYDTDNTGYFHVSCGHQPDDLGIASFIANKKSADGQLAKVLSGYEITDAESSRMDVSDFPESNKYYSFVVDGSGSMSGDRIKKARDSLTLAIRQLPEGSLYSILVFGSNYDYAPNFLYPVNERSVPGVDLSQPIHYGYYCDSCRTGPISGERWNRTGNDYDLCRNCYQSNLKLKPDMADKFKLVPPPEQKSVAELAGKSSTSPGVRGWIVHNDESYLTTIAKISEFVEAKYGGTEMMTAMQTVYDRLLPDVENVVVLITDADIGEPQTTNIHMLARQHSAKPEVFCLGIGTGHQTEFLDGLARIGNGVAKHITRTDEIKESVQRLMRCAIGGKFLRNLNVSVPGHVNISTTKPLDVYFHGEPFDIYLSVDKTKITGDEVMVLRSGDKELLSVPLLIDTPSTFDLEHVFHMTHLDQMLRFPELYRTFGEPEEGKMSKADYTKFVTDLACKLDVITPYTSAVIVEELVNQEDGSVELKKIDIPLGMPQKYEDEQAVFNKSGGNLIRSFGMLPPGAMHGLRRSKLSSMKKVCTNENVKMSCSIDPPDEEDCDMECDMGDLFSGVDTSVPKSYTTTTQTATQPVKSSAEDLIELFVKTQSISNGNWKYDERLLTSFMKAKWDVYEQITGKLSDEQFMTLMILAFFNFHSEFYSTYNSAEPSAYEYLNSQLGEDKVSDMVTKLVQVGF